MTADDDFRAYLACWKIALREFLGWSDLETERWATKWRPSHPHELPRDRAMWYVCDLLIPEKLREPGALRGETVHQFKGRVQHSIDCGSTTAELQQLQCDRLDEKLATEEWLERFELVKEKEIDAGNWLSELHPEKYNWKAARMRINKILGEYGHGLPQLD